MKTSLTSDLYDFSIVGAGLAGILMAIELRKLGHSIILIEKNKSILRPVCGEYLSPEGVKLLQDLGYSNLLKSYALIDGMVLHTPTWKKVSTTFPGNRFGLSLNRQKLQSDLLEMYQEMGGRIFFHQSLTSIHRKDSSFEIQTTDHTFHSKKIIGADGRASRVAKILNLKSIELQEKRMAIHVYLKPLRELQRKGQMHILPNGCYVGINPINDHEVNFSIVADAELVRSSGGPRDFLNFWISHSRALREDFPLITNEEIKTTYPISRDSIDIISESVALIGDASGFIDPLTGEGMTTAIKTVQILSQEIKQHGLSQLAFKNYELQRKKDWSEKEKLNRGFQILIKKTWACELVYLLLSSSQNLRDTFIGIVGNIYRPSEGAAQFLKSIFEKKENSCHI